MNKTFYEKLVSIIEKERILIDEPMSRHTSFRIGGKADFVLMPKSIEEVQGIIATCKKGAIPYYILGNGSNLLVGDKGYRGVIINMGKDFGAMKLDAEAKTITVQAGALLSTIANKALRANLIGMEFAAGIPGSLGGAVVMNAGAYGGEMKDILTAVTVLDQEGKIYTLTKSQLELGYRTSVVAKKGYIVLCAVIQLKQGKRDDIKARMDELKEKRITKQPLEYPSAGSTFKRPEGHFAGKLIEDAGLRGYKVGGAQVSERHCGFVINKDKATAQDVLLLMQQVIMQVEEKFQVTLEPEVKRLGEF